MENLKTKQGITLIALVITIIVLLILAGVSISAIIGENGIATKAKEAKIKTTVAKEKEFVDLAYSSVVMDSLENDVTVEKMQEEMDNLAGEGETTVTAENEKIKIVFKETGNEYIVEMSGGNEETPPTDEEKVEGTREDWKIIENGDGTATISYFRGTYPDDGIMVIPNMVDGLEITKLEVSSEDSSELKGTSYGPDKACIIYVKPDSGLYNTSTTLYNANIKRIIVSEGIITIGLRAFAMTNIEDVELPNTIINIDESAFESCKVLTNINIPSSVTTIGSKAFAYCDNLTSITYEGTKAQWNLINKGNNWNLGSTLLKTVICTDGNISL